MASARYSLPVLDRRTARHPAPFDVGHEPGIGIQVGDAPVLEIPDALEQQGGVRAARLRQQRVEPRHQFGRLVSHGLERPGQPLVIGKQRTIVSEDQPAAKQR